MSDKPVALVWFRRDLRASDHAPLLAALERGFVPVPVFVWAPDEEAPRAPGGASRRWLHAALQDVSATLTALGSRLIVRQGPTRETLATLIAETGAKAVYWHRVYEPAFMSRDAALKEAWRAAGLEAESFAGDCLIEPQSVKTKAGTPFKVFTPFWNHVLTLDLPAAKPAPTALPAPAVWPGSDPVASLGLCPSIPWDTGIAAAWDMTRAGGDKRLRGFLKTTLPHYADRRDLPWDDGTSRLSPYLHFGQLSPREVRDAALKTGGPGAAKFLSEIGWREFGRHLLYHFPKTPAEPMDAGFANFPWADNPALAEAWRRGRTGVPIVDAGLRELWSTGFMHNRVRMIAGSFLVKNLLTDWRAGAAWFWDTLVDADLAQNTLGWQWIGGCGADAAPYFRVFNPVLQGGKFDADGDYVKRYVPELAGLPAKWIHRPWEAPEEVLARAGVSLGETYPEPVVGLALSRVRALDAYQRRRG